jgi:Glycine zipper
MRGRRNVKVGAALAALLMIGGCDQQFSTTQKATGVGTVLGAGSGALIGSAVGHPVVGTLVGAGVGGAGGYMVGRGLQSNEDAQAQTQAQVSSQQRQIESQRRQIQELQNSANTE